MMLGSESKEIKEKILIKTHPVSETLKTMKIVRKMIKSFQEKLKLINLFNH